MPSRHHTSPKVRSELFRLGEFVIDGLGESRAHAVRMVSRGQLLVTMPVGEVRKASSEQA